MIILFDGVCNLCAHSVQFILARDGGAFQFASLQSEAGQTLLKQHQLPEDYTESLVLIKNEKAYTHSDAALHIASQLKAPWSSAALGLVFPRFLRDPLYLLIAKNRYRLFGKKEQCLMMTPELKARFLN